VRDQFAASCLGGSSRLIGARAAPPKRRQRKSTLATAIEAADRRETAVRPAKLGTIPKFFAQ
jgi:hypothetical protein